MKNIKILKRPPQSLSNSFNKSGFILLLWTVKVILAYQDGGTANDL